MLPQDGQPVKSPAYQRECRLNICPMRPACEAAAASAAACASIPVIRNLEEYYDNDLLHSIRAIVNGSTNFILTKMFEEKLDFKEALLLAQQLLLGC